MSRWLADSETAARAGHGAACAHGEGSSTCTDCCVLCRVYWVGTATQAAGSSVKHSNSLVNPHASHPCEIAVYQPHCGPHMVLAATMRAAACRSISAKSQSRILLLLARCCFWMHLGFNLGEAITVNDSTRSNTCHRLPGYYPVHSIPCRSSPLSTHPMQARRRTALLCIQQPCELFNCSTV